MKSLRMWTLLLALVGLASCAPVLNDPCAGWRPVRVAAETLGYLAAHDAQTLAGLIAHHETGQRRGCWK